MPLWVGRHRMTGPVIPTWVSGGRGEEGDDQDDDDHEAAALWPQPSIRRCHLSLRRTRAQAAPFGERT